ncbi:MAG: pilus assembly protein TadG-related protein [Micrococcales bacterium]
MSDERGSLTVLGLFVTLGILLTAAVTLNASTLYLQQRQVQNLSDALALDLADLQLSRAVTFADAQAELTLLDTTERVTVIKTVSFDAPKVSVVLCQNPESLFELRGLLALTESSVCTKSVATAN